MRKKLLKTMLVGAVLVTGTLAQAGEYKFVTGLEVRSVLNFKSGVIRVDFKNNPEGTCSSWGYSFALTKTGDWQEILKRLNEARILKKKVSIGYITSDTPGANNEGCTSMADIESVVSE